MQFKLLGACLLLSSFAFAGTDAQAQAPRSVSVLNLSNNSVDLWMNGEYRELSAGKALLYPCLHGEKVEVQIGSQLNYLECGDKKEISE